MALTDASQCKTLVSSNKMQLITISESASRELTYKPIPPATPSLNKHSYTEIR